MQVSAKHLILPVIAMAVILVASNKLVSIPVNDWLVWGTLTYPFAFVVTDLTNRHFGAPAARKIIYIGFVIGVIASLYFADPRIALASGFAFLIAQLCDISIFDRLRESRWWIAPLTSSVFSTVLDTFLFFFLAFVASGQPWMQWATTDLMMKWLVALVALIPYRLFSSPRAVSA